MPKAGATQVKAVPVLCDENEHIIKYPRLRRGNHFADFMRDKRIHPEVYHCIIQREGSKEILSWTQDSTLDAAIKNAEVTLALIVGATAAQM